MNELHDYIQSQNISVHQAKEIIRTYENMRKYEWIGKCNVCFKRLTMEEIASHRLDHFHHTCFDHRDYGGHLDLFQIRKKLKLPQLDSDYSLKDFK